MQKLITTIILLSFIIQSTEVNSLVIPAHAGIHSHTLRPIATACVDTYVKLPRVVGKGRAAKSADARKSSTVFPKFSGIRMISLGGHAFIGPEDKTVTPQSQRARVMAAFTPEVVASFRPGTPVTHGNGPQAGMLLEEKYDLSRMTPDEVSRALIDDRIVERTQIDMGEMIKEAWIAQGVPAEDIVVFITEIEADDTDKTPVKSLGVVNKVKVRSPVPKHIVRIKDIADAIKSGKYVIACGGGGIPVDTNGNVIGGVIDKDLATALLATELRAYGVEIDELVICTDQPYVYNEFGKPETAFSMLTPEQIDELLRNDPEGKRFPKGSIRPKMQAAALFIRGGGRSVRITTLENIGSGDGTLVRAQTQTAPGKTNTQSPELPAASKNPLAFGLVTTDPMEYGPDNFAFLTNAGIGERQNIRHLNRLFENLDNAGRYIFCTFINTPPYPYAWSDSALLLDISSEGEVLWTGNHTGRRFFPFQLSDEDLEIAKEEMRQERGAIDLSHRDQDGHWSVPREVDVTGAKVVGIYLMMKSIYETPIIYSWAQPNFVALALQHGLPIVLAQQRPQNNQLRLFEEFLNDASLIGILKERGFYTEDYKDRIRSLIVPQKTAAAGLAATRDTLNIINSELSRFSRAERERKASMNAAQRKLDEVSRITRGSTSVSIDRGRVNTARSELNFAEKIYKRIVREKAEALHRLRVLQDEERRLVAQSAVSDAPKPVRDSGNSIPCPAQDTRESSTVSPELLGAPKTSSAGKSPIQTPDASAKIAKIEDGPESATSVEASRAAPDAPKPAGDFGDSIPGPAQPAPAAVSKENKTVPVSASVSANRVDSEISMFVKTYFTAARDIILNPELSQAAAQFFLGITEQAISRMRGEIGTDTMSEALIALDAALEHFKAARECVTSVEKSKWPDTWLSALEGALREIEEANKAFEQAGLSLLQKGDNERYQKWELLRRSIMVSRSIVLQSSNVYAREYHPLMHLRLKLAITIGLINNFNDSRLDSLTALILDGTACYEQKDFVALSRKLTQAIQKAEYLYRVSRNDDKFRYALGAFMNNIYDILLICAANIDKLNEGASNTLLWSQNSTVSTKVTVAAKTPIFWKTTVEGPGFQAKADLSAVASSGSSAAVKAEPVPAPVNSGDSITGPAQDTRESSPASPKLPHVVGKGRAAKSAGAKKLSRAREITELTQKIRAARTQDQAPVTAPQKVSKEAMDNLISRVSNFLKDHRPGPDAYLHPSTRLSLEYMVRNRDRASEPALIERAEDILSWHAMYDTERREGHFTLDNMTPLEQNILRRIAAAWRGHHGIEGFKTRYKIYRDRLSAEVKIALDSRGRLSDKVIKRITKSLFINDTLYSQSEPHGEFSADVIHMAIPRVERILSKLFPELNIYPRQLVLVSDKGGAILNGDTSVEAAKNGSGVLNYTQKIQIVIRALRMAGLKLPVPGDAPIELAFLAYELIGELPEGVLEDWHTRREKELALVTILMDVAAIPASSLELDETERIDRLWDTLSGDILFGPEAEDIFEEIILLGHELMRKSKLSSLETNYKIGAALLYGKGDCAGVINYVEQYIRMRKNMRQAMDAYMPGSFTIENDYVTEGILRNPAFQRLYLMARMMDPDSVMKTVNKKGGFFKYYLNHFLGKTSHAALTDEDARICSAAIAALIGLASSYVSRGACDRAKSLVENLMAVMVTELELHHSIGQEEEIEGYLKYARKLMSDIHILRGDGPVSPGPTGKKSFGAMDLPETPGKTSSAGLAAQSAVLDAPKPTGDSGGSITGPAQDTWKSSIVSPKLLTAISQAA